MKDINQYIDHTLLKAGASKEQVTALCEEAKQYHFSAVCINSVYVPLSVKLLSQTQVKVCTVVGFPLGASPVEVKLLEAKIALDHGAQEIDMVINISDLKDSREKNVQNEIEQLAQLCHSRNALLKVIIETCLLTKEEKIKACELAKNAQADFVKTSTGFSHEGATIEDVKLMREVVGDHMGVKASGGIRDLETAKEMISAGASRLGMSASVKLMSTIS